jgi:peptide deformylase
MKLIYYPNEILSKQLTPVDIKNPTFDPKELKQQMVDFMLANDGIGLTANQIGLDANVFVMGDSTSNSSMCINPTVVQYTEETDIDIEGCLSFPGVYVKVKRPKEILAEYYNENLEKQIEKITGYSARCYLHELDHTLGITFKDRVSRVKWDIAQRKRKKIGH